MTKKQTEETVKLGTFSGVFVPSFEAIMGAVLFVLLAQLIGGIGLWRMLLIILLAHSVSVATTFSISDCVTNLHRIGDGGMYVITRKSLGRAFGGSIGLQLYLAQTASIAFYCVAFVDPIFPYLAQWPVYQEAIRSLPLLATLQHSLSAAAFQQVQLNVITTLVYLVIFTVTMFGAGFIIKIQKIILVLLIFAIITIFFGPLYAPDAFQSLPNISGSDLGRLGFWAAFTAFFPAVVGIDSGVGMSGALKNPRKSLVNGTFLAIGVTFLVYAGLTILMSFLNPKVVFQNNASLVTYLGQGGLIITLIILTGWLVATASSAFSCFMTAPRTAQAMAEDRIWPRFLRFLRYDFFSGGKEPRFAVLLTFLIALPVIWAGDIRIASTIVGICFLVVYSWVNLSAFLERASRNPNFRPTFRNHWLISLYGFVMTLVVISLFNIWIGIGVVVFQAAVFLWLLRYKSHLRLEGVWWGIVFRVIAFSFNRLRSVVQGHKNWRPIMCSFSFADSPESTKTVCDIANRITRRQGLVYHYILTMGSDQTESICATEFTRIVDISQTDTLMERVNRTVSQRAEIESKFTSVILALTQASSVGPVPTNAVLFTYDQRVDWYLIVDHIIGMRKDVFLYLPGSTPDGIQAAERIDVWWRGENNGNLMAVMAYIINVTEKNTNNTTRPIRLIRKISAQDNAAEAREKMEHLLEKARLNGEVTILHDDESDFFTDLHRHSKDAWLILLGVPGERREGVFKPFYSSKNDFNNTMKQYESLPPILFTKASRTMELIEE